MTDNQTKEKRPALWLLFVVMLMGFIVKMIEGPKTAVDWITMIAMLAAAIVIGLTLSGRTKPK